MLSVIFFIAWKSMGGKRHALTWSITFIFAALQWTTNLLSDRFPSYEIYWVVVSAITLTAVTFGLLGHCQRVGRQVSFSIMALPPILCLSAIAYFTFESPHTGLRVGLNPAYAAATILLSAILILAHRKHPRPAEWGAALTMIVFAVSQFVAAGVAIAQGANFNATYASLYAQINFLALPAAYTGMGMFVVFMLASDLSEQMKEAAVRDQLTGLLNRRGFSESAAKAYATARRTGRGVSVIMTDIDRFKSINDTYGHSTGDEALCHFAEILAEGRRSEDILARVGGEEFSIILPGTDVKNSVQIATELCRRLEATPMKTDDGPLVMTASFGVATISTEDTCLSDVIVRADTALYRSKRKGRNRVDLMASQIMLLADGELKPLSR